MHGVPCCVIKNRQLQKCLDILATDGESVTDLSQYYKNHQEELQKMITLLNPKGLSMLDSQEILDDDDEKMELVRQSSLNSYAGSVSLYQDNYVSRNSLRHLSEDQTDLNRLLNRKEENDSDSSGPIQKIKKLKTNFFTKRFTKRKGDKKGEKQDDTVSLKSNSSDTSRLSFYDIKNEFKKFKRIKKPKFHKTGNKEDEGEGMASILARSVIHARTTLACITETQDSQAENSPCSTMRRTIEPEPNAHTGDDNSKTFPDQERVEDTKKVPEIQFSSLKNISSEDLVAREPRVRRISESCPTSPMAGRSDNLLKLPGDKGYFGSVSSALSGESSIYSSSEDEDESSDLKTDTDEALETTSSIVKSVLKYESDPAFIAQMDRKLTVVQNIPPKISESLLADFDERATQSMAVALDQVETSEGPEKESKEIECKVEKAELNVVQMEKLVTSEAPTSTKEVETCVFKPNTHYIKIHNPFAHRKTSASISCPSSPVEKHNFVYRSSKRIKDKISKISKSNMIKSISHISLFPKKREPKTVSQSGSISDVPSYPSRCPSETVLGSHFLSYSDLLGLDKDRIQANKLCKSDEIGNSKFSMYIGSEPASRCSISGPSHPHSRDEHDHKKDKHSLKPTGLIHTAMETMLIDKIESLLIPTSPEIAVNTKFFDDVSEKLEEHKNSGAAMRHLQSTTGSTTPRIVAVTPKRLSEDLTANVYTKHQESMLMDKAQAVLPDTTEAIHSIEWHEGYDNEKLRAVHKTKEPRGSISTLMDKVHFHPHFFHHKKDDSSHDIRSGGLIHAAMQTMLIDRAQSMIPDTPEPIPVHTEPDFGEIGKHHKHHDHAKEHGHIKDKESTGLIHSALQTMLIDNVQSVLPDSDEPIPIRTEADFGEDFHKNHGHTKDKQSTGLVHSALQTMLIDNIQSVLPDSDQPIPIRTEPAFDDTKSQKSLGNDKESTGLVHSALQTMLIDNVESVLPNSDQPIPINIDSDTERKRNDCKINATGLVHSAMETMLLDKAQALINPKVMNVEYVSEKKDIEVLDHETHNVNKEEKCFDNTAMETMLVDRMQAMFPKATEANTKEIHVEKIQDNDTELKSTGLVKNAMQTILIDKAAETKKDLTESVDKELDHSELKSWSEDNKDGSSDSTRETKGNEEISKLQKKFAVKNKEVIKKKDTDDCNIEVAKQKEETEDRNKEATKQKKAFEERNKHFTRQDSVQSNTSNKMSNEANAHKVTKALLQNFHPILSGGLETIPSEECNDSFDRSIDETNNTSAGDVTGVAVEGSTVRSETASTSRVLPTVEGSVDRTGETNRASVCDNSHAACRFDRERERDRDRSEKGSPKHSRHESCGGREPLTQNSSLNASSTPMGIHRRSSDSDLSVTPKGIYCKI